MILQLENVKKTITLKKKNRQWGFGTKWTAQHYKCIKYPELFSLKWLILWYVNLPQSITF